MRWPLLLVACVDSPLPLDIWHREGEVREVREGKGLWTVLANQDMDQALAWDHLLLRLAFICL